jgi:hypothetical protein
MPGLHNGVVITQGITGRPQEMVAIPTPKAQVIFFNPVRATIFSHNASFSVQELLVCQHRHQTAIAHEA